MAVEFIDALSPEAEKRIKAYNTLVLELIGNIGKANSVQVGGTTPSGTGSAIKKLQTQVVNTQAALQSLQNTYLQVAAQINANTQSINTQTASTAALLAQLNNTNAALQTNVQANNAVTASRKSSNQQTTQEIVNQAILNRNAKQMAVIQSTLAGAYQKLSAQEAQSARILQDLIARGKTATQTQRQFNAEVRAAQKEFDGYRKRLIAADEATGRWARTSKRTLSEANELASVLGLSLGIAGVAALGKNIFYTTKELESMNLALKNVTGSSQEALDVQVFLSQVAEDYGIDIQTLTKSYINFFSSSKNAIESGKISAGQIRDIFQSVSKAAGAMGLSVEQQEGAFLALSQMISKGNVQAEELRGQLSERLPGAFGILAKSMGITEKQLNQMLKDGKVLAAEVLPAFARELEKAYGVENLNRVETLNAAVTRLGNSWRDFVKSLNEGDGIFSAVLAGTIQALSDALKGASIALSSQASKDADLQSKVRQRAYKETLEHYEKIKLADSAYLANKKIWLLQDIKILQDQQKVNKEANEEIRKNNPAAFLSAAQKSDINENNTANRALALQIKRLYGIIAAGDEIIKRNIKNEKDIAEAMDYSNIVLAAKIRYLKELTDASRAVYEAEKKRREIDIENTKQLADNDNSEFSDRITHLGEYLKKRQDLLQYSFDYELSQSQKQRAKDLDEAEKAEKAAIKQIKGKTKDADLTKEQQSAINAVFDFYRKERTQIGIKSDAIDLKNQREFSDAYMDVAEETSRAEVLIRQKQREILRNTDKIYLDEQADVFKRASENEKLSLDVRQAAFQSYISVRQSQLQTDRQAAIASAKTDEELKQVIATYDVLKRKLDAEAKDDPYKKASEQSQAALRSLAESFQSSFLGDAGLGSIQQFFDGTFDKIIEGFDKMENKQDAFREKSIYTALVISEAFQEMYNFLNQASKKNFDAEREQLDQKYKIDRLFAGENEAAIAELDKERERRQKEIANREARANKQLAIFNIGINAAQGIIGAFKDGNVIKGAIFAALIAGVAAAQIAVVNAQQIPQYFKGTDNHPGGLMMVNDAKGSKYREIIQTPDGKMHAPTGRNKVINAPKGTKVFDADRSALMFDNGLNNILNERGVLLSQPIQNNNYSMDVEKLADRIDQAVSRIPQTYLKQDNDGLGKFIKQVTGNMDFQNKRIKIIPTTRHR